MWLRGSWDRRLQRSTGWAGGNAHPIRFRLPGGRLEWGPARCSLVGFQSGAVLHCWGGGAARPASAGMDDGGLPPKSTIFTTVWGSHVQPPGMGRGCPVRKPVRGTAFTFVDIRAGQDRTGSFRRLGIHPFELSLRYRMAVANRHRSRCWSGTMSSKAWGPARLYDSESFAAKVASHASAMARPSRFSSGRSHVPHKMP